MAPGTYPFLVLAILDGWGLGKKKRGNAIFEANTMNMDRLCSRFPWTRLASSGEDVGLPADQMGNSEVGHLNLGAGRVVLQESLRITRSIRDGSFFHNEVLVGAVGKARERGSSLHLMGLLSDGGVHSYTDHLFVLLEMAHRAGLEKVFVHAILDGRDVPPQSASRYLQELEERLSSLGTGQLASIAGRYYAMDRDRRWERTSKAYQAYVYSRGRRAATGREALHQAYSKGETDEFVLPTLIAEEGAAPAFIGDADAVIFYNFRSDRARQISRAFVEREFKGFDRGARPPLPHFACMTEYDIHLQAPVAFPPRYVMNTLGETLSGIGRRQLRVAETEKYAHVTYFFNGGREEPFPLEERVLVPSPRVPTYDLKPEMSALGVTLEVSKALETEAYTLIVVNYANADMIGHTGKLNAAIKAVEAVDWEVGMLAEKVLQKGGALLIVGDHGNAEEMMAEDGSPLTAHTRNDTPFVLVAPHREYRLLDRGKLADVAPTVLKLLDLPASPEMDGTPLAEEISSVRGGE